MLLISAHFIKSGRVGGAEQVLYNLVEGFCSNKVSFRLLLGDKGRLAPDFVGRLERHGDDSLIVCGGKSARFIAEQQACLDARLKGDAILFPNYFTPPVIPRRCGRVVTIIHDCQYRHYPQYFSARKRAWLRLAHRLTFLRAHSVVAISEFVRADIGRLYGKNAAAKTVVIPNPVSWDRFGEAKGPHPLGSRSYILTVAAQFPHKNLTTLIRAFAIIASRDNEIQLVLAGQVYEKLVGVPSREHDIRGLVESLNLGERVHITGYIEDELLGCYYRNAALFAFPSVFEGFGLPPVEALGFGVPTLTTRCASLPEVTLGRAEYVQDPYDIDEWADRMQVMLDQPERFDVSAETTAAIRTRYAPKRIARMYANVLLGET